MAAPSWRILTRCAVISLITFICPCNCANSTGGGLLSRFEVDVIFPRNETYKPADVFPIAIAVQNFTELSTIGNFTLIWDVMPFTDGWIPGGITYDVNYFELKNSIDINSGAATILIDNTNVTAWISKKQRHTEQYMLQYYIIDYGMQDRCGHHHDGIVDGVMFSVVTQAEEEQQSYYNQTINATVPDILQVPECPVLGSVADVQPNSTISSCFDFALNEHLDEGDPCAVVVDQPIASSISSRAASIATAAMEATAVSATPEPSNTNLAGAVQPPILAGSVVVCILSSLTFSWGS